MPPNRPPDTTDARRGELDDSTQIGARPDFSEGDARRGAGELASDEGMATVVRPMLPVGGAGSELSLISAQEFIDAAIDPEETLSPLRPLLRAGAKRADMGNAAGRHDRPGRVPAPSPPTGAGAPDAEQVEVRKWRAGVPDAPLSSVARADGAAQVEERRASLGVVPLTPTPATPSAPGAVTRVDTPAFPATPRSLDVGELLGILEDAERLLKSARVQAAGLDLEPRGLNAQMTAALHRLAEALDLLRRS